MDGWENIDLRDIKDMILEGSIPAESICAIIDVLARDAYGVDLRGDNVIDMKAWRETHIQG